MKITCRGDGSEKSSPNTTTLDENDSSYYIKLYRYGKSAYLHRLWGHQKFVFAQYFSYISQVYHTHTNLAAIICAVYDIGQAMYGTLSQQL